MYEISNVDIFFSARCPFCEMLFFLFDGSRAGRDSGIGHENPICEYFRDNESVEYLAMIRQKMSIPRIQEEIN